LQWIKIFILEKFVD